MAKAEQTPISLPVELTWNQSAIDQRLAQVEMSANRENETPRHIRAQIVLVKTANAPHNLQRLLTTAIDVAQRSATSSDIVLGVIDDSPDAAIRVENQTIISTVSKQKGFPIEKITTHDLLPTHFIFQLRSAIIDYAGKNNLSYSHKKKLLFDLQLLLSERFNISSPDLNQHDFSPAYLAKIYSHIGEGANSTTNMALLFSAYLMGKKGLSPEQAISTINEDDIVYGTMELKQGLPAFTGHDFFRERELLFSHPDTQFVAGKYVGMSGNPVVLLKSALEVTSGIILNYRNYNNHQAISPYPYYDRATGTFRQITIQEAFDHLPEIIDQFLSRTPVTAFILPKPRQFDRWIFDQGNFSVLGSLAQKVPFPTTGIAEFTMTAVYKSLLRNYDLSKAMALETPILHLRSIRSGRLDVYPDSLISGMTTTPIRINQKLLEMVLGQPDEKLNDHLQQVFIDEKITVDILRSNLPHIEKVRGNTPQVFRKLRDFLSLELANLKLHFSENDPLITSITRLISEVAEENLSQISAVPEEITLEEATKYFKRFLNAVRSWPIFYQLAWEIGQKETQH